MPRITNRAWKRDGSIKTNPHATYDFSFYLYAERKSDHGQFSVVSRISCGQVEVGEVHDVVVLLALLVEEPERKAND